MATNVLKQVQKKVMPRPFYRLMVAENVQKTEALDAYQNYLMITGMSVSKNAKNGLFKLEDEVEFKRKVRERSLSTTTWDNKPRIFKMMTREEIASFKQHKTGLGRVLLKTEGSELPIIMSENDFKEVLYAEGVSDGVIQAPMVYTNYGWCTPKRIQDIEFEVKQYRKRRQQTMQDIQPKKVQPVPGGIYYAVKGVTDDGSEVILRTCVYLGEYKSPDEQGQIGYCYREMFSYDKSAQRIIDKLKDSTYSTEAKNWLITSVYNSGKIPDIRYKQTKPILIPYEKEVNIFDYMKVQHIHTVFNHLSEVYKISGLPRFKNTTKLEFDLDSIKKQILQRMMI